MLQFLEAHQTVIAVGAYYVFSSLCSSMPELPDKAGYLLTWAHNFLQAIAANINKIKR